MDAVSQAAVLEERDREPLILRALVPAIVAEPMCRYAVVGGVCTAVRAPTFAVSPGKVTHALANIMRPSNATDRRYSARPFSN
jgi:hypothetical protein